MALTEHQERWPFIRQSNVAGACRDICKSVEDLERAFEAGELPGRLTSGCFEQVLGPELCKSYVKLANSSPGPLRRLRVDAVSRLLAQLRNDLSPSHFARARVRISPEGDAWTTESGADFHPPSRFKLVDARFDGTASTTLRFDQMLDARFWRIGFTFETGDLGDAFAQEVVRSATGRLAIDLRDLQDILHRSSQRTLDRTLRIVPDREEKRFEHLILDILNEDGLHARRARLVEDFREKTDLRVSYPELSRKSGARVQVTSIIAPEHHEAKRQAIKLADEFVFLSPLSLAEHVYSLQDSTSVTEVPGSSQFALAALWDCVGVEPGGLHQLASELKQSLFRAMTERPCSPLGHIVDYGAFIDIGVGDGLLHLSGIPGAVKGMIGAKLAKGKEIEVEVLGIDIDQKRISLRIPLVDKDAN